MLHFLAISIMLIHVSVHTRSSHAPASEGSLQETAIVRCFDRDATLLCEGTSFSRAYDMPSHIIELYGALPRSFRGLLNLHLSLGREA